jgi:hypothetical protein
VSVRDQLLEEFNEAEPKGLGKISYFEFFLPIHREIVDILKTKIHLHEETELPTDFKNYIAHYGVEQLVWRAADFDIGAWDMVRAYDFPKQLPGQLQEGRKVVERRYEEAMKELRRKVYA